MPEDVDPLLAGRGGLSYDELDAAAHRLHDLLTATAERQIDRPLLHEFTIDVDTSTSTTLEPPPGYRRPATGAITTHLDVRSRSSQRASLQLRVVVWPALGGADVVDLLVTLDGAADVLEVRLDEVEPEATDALRHRVNDWVARRVALVVGGLNVAMQRALGDPDWDGGEA